MGKCSHCGTDPCPITIDDCKVCCANCGKILSEEIYSSEPTFFKDKSGQSCLGSNFLRSFGAGISICRERTLMKARDEIRDIVYSLNIGGGETIIDGAHNLYRIAIGRAFTKGRITKHVAASCLYIACRMKKSPYLLIDFSDCLRVNVYVLGAVFLKLCKLLLESDDHIVQKLVDPSLFIHRFTEQLLGKRNNAVSETALRILASMKRDWMVTGRKPNGLCGGALYIAALSHGFDYSISEIASVVHVCEGTLTKRLIEFENTEFSSLTMEEFLVKIDELEKETKDSISNQQPKEGDLLCKHKDTTLVTHFAHGLCKKCYHKFVKISGGLEGDTDPPAFQKAEMQRKKEEAKIGESSSKLSVSEEEETIEGNQAQDESAILNGSGHESGDVFENNEKVDDCEKDETLSDIDDTEVDEYLNNEEEKHYKKIIWEEMNKEYLEEQELKEAAKKLAEEKEPHKVRKRKHEEEDKVPAKTPCEATYNFLKRKGFASKVNLDALEDLYTMNQEKIGTRVPKGDDERKYLDEYAEFEENDENNGNESNDFCTGEFDFD